MTQNSALPMYLEGEIEALEPFAFVGVVPALADPSTLSRSCAARTEGSRCESPAVRASCPSCPLTCARHSATCGFSSEDASEPGNPWAHEVDDAAAAVALVQNVIVEVFGEKPDVNTRRGPRQPQARARRGPEAGARANSDRSDRGRHPGEACGTG